MLPIPSRTRSAAIRLIVGTIAGLAFSTSAWGQTSFQEVADLWGVDHTWGTEWPAGDLGGGIALEDFDRDGDPDLFLNTRLSDTVRAFLNDGTGFTEVDLGLNTGGSTKQLLFADFDNDGWRDLFCSGWTVPHSLFRNRGDGTFENVSAAAQLVRPQDDPTFGQATGATAGDYDRDGDLDLYVSYWTAGPPQASSTNALFRNDGDLVFTNVTDEMGVGDIKKSYQCLFADLSGDGWPDLVIGEDKSGGLTYYENFETEFRDMTEASGLDGILASTQTRIDGMGLAAGDYDNDGRLDLYATNIFEGNLLYLNRGDGTFLERAEVSGVLSRRWGWGVGWMDVDNDGFQDLYVANASSAFNNTNRLFRNVNGISFVDIAPQANVALAAEAFGMASADLDDNGFVDIVVSHGATPTAIFLNDGASDGRWLQLELVGTDSNRDGIGARVQVDADGFVRTQELRAGTSYLSHDDLRMEFGVGESTTAQVSIQWPSGQQDVYAMVPTGNRYRAVEGSTALVSLTDTPPVSSLVLGRPAPNPFNPMVAVPLQIPDDVSHLTARVMDLRGRLVRVLHDGPFGADFELQWDGQRDDGQPAVSGSYRIVVSAGDDRAVTAVTLIR